jgi:hypothetical protein
MRSSSRTVRTLVAGTLALLAGAVAVLGTHTFLSHDVTGVSAGAASVAPTSSSTTTTTTAPVVVPPPPRFATGNAQLDALLPRLPALLFEGGATVRFGWNPLDTCCHAGGYNPEPNEVWVGQSAFTSGARLTYVAVHELAHSVHLKTARAAALTAAVAGAPVVSSGAWDDSEKVADCAAWVFAPVETAASGITYWDCPDPWRSQVRAALQ